MEPISYVYTIPYVLHLAVLMILAYVELYEGQRMKQVVMQLSVLSLVLFYGLRGYVGMDVFAYHAAFRDLPTLWDWNAEDFFAQSNYEIGFKFYMVVLKSVFSDYATFQLVNTLFDIILLHCVLRRHATVSYAFSMALFLSFMGMVYMVDQLRNCKGLLLFFMSIRYAQKGMFGKYLLMNLLGSLFHVSSLLFILLYPLLRKQMSRRTVWMLFGMGIVVFFFRLNLFDSLIDWLISCSIPIVSKKLVIYMDDMMYSSVREVSFGSLYSLVGNFFLMYLICWRYYQRLKTDEKTRFFVNLFIVYIMSFFFFQWSMITSTRLPSLFVFGSVVLIPHLLKMIDGVRTKTLYFGFFSLYLLANITMNTTNIEYNYRNMMFQTDGLAYRWTVHQKATQERERFAKPNEQR
jgi:hypothetical protein